MQASVLNIYFDGGFNSRAYGSWLIEGEVIKARSSRESYDGSSCNVAEYQALIGALNALAPITIKSVYHVRMFGDSKLVVNQVRRKWKCRAAHLKPYRDRVLELLQGFGHWEITWRPRAHSVILFGH